MFEGAEKSFTAFSKTWPTLELSDTPDLSGEPGVDPVGVLHATQD